MGRRERSDTDDGHVPLFGSTRLGLSIIMFFGFCNLYMQRVNMSVAMVCMINNTAIQDLTSINESNVVIDTCPVVVKNNTSKNSMEGTFVWSKAEQGIILGAFFWGYLSTQLLGGVLADKVGGQRVFGISMIISSICTALTPLAAYGNFWFLIVIRVLCGVSQGVVFPSTHSMWSNWAPPLERSVLVGLSYAGTQMGNVLTFPVSGMLCSSYGWETIFYSFGTVGVIWSVAWLIWTRDSPAKHNRISHRERRFIQRSLKGQTSTPWKSILTSAPVWAIVVAHTTALFATYLVLTMLPSYMSNVLRFDIKSNGFLSAVPYIAFFICIQISTQLADFVRSRRWLNTTHTRKLAVVIAFAGQGAFMVATGYLGDCHSPLLAVGLLSASQGLSGFQFSGFLVNHVDIAPRYAGTLFGLSNTFATISGIVAPFAASVIAPDGTAEQWLTVFWVSAAILMFGLIFYSLFGSGEIQSWAVVPVTSISEAVLDTLIKDRAYVDEEKVRTNE